LDGWLGELGRKNLLLVASPTKPAELGELGELGDLGDLEDLGDLGDLGDWKPKKKFSFPAGNNYQFFLKNKK
jgi:hypothetical protein